MNTEEIDEQSKALQQELVDALSGTSRLGLVKAPPGSGKTYMLLAVTADLVRKGLRVAIAAQTNRQADDIARRWASKFPDLPAWRLGSKASHAPNGFPPSVTWLTSADDISDEPGLTIATTAKWTTVRDPDPFDLLAVDEAWQIGWGDLMLCAKLSRKFFLIGDPGQIAPIVKIDVRRWETAPRPAHKPAPEVVLDDPDLRAEAFVSSLPACRRLPRESVDYIKPFYDFDFEPYAKEGERSVNLTNTDADPLIVSMVNMLGSGQPVVATLPTPEEGLTAEVDIALAVKVAEVVTAMLGGDSSVKFDSDMTPRPIQVSDIGLCSTHRAMNGELRRALGAELSDVAIDTPERWQGLERPIMIVVHPLSGVTEPSDFDLATGRLCVMASRHQAGLIVVARDHVGKTLEEFIPVAEQAPGQPDLVGRGHFAHGNFWNALVRDERVVSLI